MTWDVDYIRTFAGFLKVFQFGTALTAIILLSLAHYNIHTDHLMMRPPALLMAMVNFSFFVTSLVIFMSIVMGSAGTSRSIFYRVHGVLATVGFAVAAISYMAEDVGSVPPKMGILAATLCILNSLTFIADTIIAYETSTPISPAEPGIE